MVISNVVFRIKALCKARLSSFWCKLCNCFVIAAIRNDKLITGINFKGREYKLSQYADDTSCLVRDEKSVEKLFEKLQAFRGCCALDLNKSKTEALLFGKTSDHNRQTFST